MKNYKGEPLIVYLIGWPIIYAILLAAPGSSLLSLQGWLFSALYFGFVLALIAVLARNNRALLWMREGSFGSRPQENEPIKQWWKEVLFPLVFILAFVPLLSLVSDIEPNYRVALPIWLQAIGGAVVFCSFCLTWLAFGVTSSVSTFAGVRAKSGQPAVATGPYCYVRYPTYGAFILLFIGMFLLFRSWYDLGVGLFFLGTFVIDVRREESTLREKLPGYADYMAQVKYRLVPNIW